MRPALVTARIPGNLVGMPVGTDMSMSQIDAAQEQTPQLATFSPLSCPIELLLTHPMASLHTHPRKHIEQIKRTVAQLPPPILEKTEYHSMILAAARSAFLYGESLTLHMLFSALSLNLSPSETLELITRVYQNEA